MEFAGSTGKQALPKIKLAWAFVAGVTLSAVLGIYQFLTQTAFASKWLGLAYHSAATLGASVVETVDGRWLRAYGSFPHPNVLAGFIITAIIFCIWLFAKTQNSVKRLLLTAYCLLLTAALFFTFSRAAWLAFLLFTVYCLLLTLRKNKKIFLYSFIPLFLFIILALIYLPLVKTRIQGAQSLEVKSNIERLSGYQESWRIIKSHPWFGVGIGNYTAELQKINPNKPAWVYQPAHNVYLLVLSEIGAVGILIIILLFSYFIIFYKKSIQNRNDVLMILMILILMFLMLFDHFWWTLPSGMLLVWLILGLGLTKFLQGVR